MAVYIRTDFQFEKQLAWLSRRLKKNKTQVIKELVEEKYQRERQRSALVHLNYWENEHDIDNREIARLEKAEGPL